MIDKTKKYRTPKGEIVTGAELVEVPPVSTAFDTVMNAFRAEYNWDDCLTKGFAEIAVTALRKAGYDLENSKSPDPEGWIEHDGGPCPVGEDTRVQVRLANSETSQACGAWFFVWHKDAVVGGTHITHYRVVGE